MADVCSKDGCLDRGPYERGNGLRFCADHWRDRYGFGPYPLLPEHELANLETEEI